MKKSLIALAVLASLAGAASAQSSVTLFGIVDADLIHGSGSISSKTQLANSGNNSSRLGFRGTEDLGGGMSASFWLEAGINTDNGTGQSTNTNNQASGQPAAGTVPNGSQGLTFNRRSTISLAGSWGEMRLGRDYTPQFTTLAVFDPFGTNGVGTTLALTSIITGATAIRASNSIGYFLPGNLGGFYGQVQYYLGENNSNAVSAVCTAPGVPVGCGVSTKEDGTGLGARFGYANGPFNVALALSKTRYATGDVSQNNIAALWDFGVVKLMGEYGRDAVNSPVAVHGRAGLIGGVVPVGVGNIKLSYSTYRIDTAGNPRMNKIALGYVHNLSKRTLLYATYARLSNSGGAAAALNGSVTAANASSTGYDLGIRHDF
jgi:predicted porin